MDVFASRGVLDQPLIDGHSRQLGEGMNPKAVVLVSVVAISAGCGGTPETQAPADSYTGNNGTPCQGSLTGTVNKSILDCRVAWVRDGEGGSGVSNWGAVVLSNQEASWFGFSFLMPAVSDPQVGSFGSSNTRGVSVTFGTGTDQGYFATYDPAPNGSPSLGSATLTLSGSEQTGVAGSFYVHGQLEATLVAPPLATYNGTINVRLAF